ncbi:hypothetical protein Tco_1327576 [Tanacetum coccineum]
MGLDNKKTIHAQSEAETMTHPKPALHPIDVENYDASHSDDEDKAKKEDTHPNSALHPIDVENYAEAMTHPKPALHPIDVENYDSSHSDDEDKAKKDVAASYRIE